MVLLFKLHWLSFSFYIRIIICLTRQEIHKRRYTQIVAAAANYVTHKQQLAYVKLPLILLMDTMFHHVLHYIVNF